MIEESWSKKEKAVARGAFENAYEKECKELIKQIQNRANEANNPNDIWRLHDFLTERIKEIEDKYDYRYSMLIFVFARLMKEGWIKIGDLEGLNEDKIAKIRYLAKIKSDLGAGTVVARLAIGRNQRLVAQPTLFVINDVPSKILYLRLLQPGV